MMIMMMMNDSRPILEVEFEVFGTTKMLTQEIDLTFLRIVAGAAADVAEQGIEWFKVWEHTNHSSSSNVW